MADSEENEKSRWAGLLIGPAIAFFALSALWKNETRFDYAKAASRTEPATSPSEAAEGASFSLTGPMDVTLTYPGEYVESFTGHLAVARDAEIYCWDRRKDDDRVTWTLKWMSSVESNSRNSGVTQQLASRTLKPTEYAVGPLTVQSERTEFCDAWESIPPAELNVTRTQLRKEGGYLMLDKGQSNGLGDERVSYDGVPVPEVATYFGRMSGGVGVADDSQQRDGWINEIIRDSGILHHIVAGDRETALATMSAHIGRLKWIVRGIGTFAVVLGFYILFATLVGFLFHIPIIGRVADWGAWLLAAVIGLPLALVVMISGFLYSHPILLGLFLGSVVGIGYWLHKRGKERQQALKEELDEEHGHTLGSGEMKELEFLELAWLAMSDGDLDEAEGSFLRKWAQKHGWDDSKFAQMIERAEAQRVSEAAPETTHEHLRHLIRLALADGTLTRYELQTIREAAKQAGFEEAAVKKLIEKVRMTTLSA